MFQLRTPRLLLRNLARGDTALIRSMTQEPAVTRYQHVLRLNTEEDIDRWVRNAIFHNRQRPRHAYNLTLVARHTAHVMGWIGWGDAEDPTYGEYSFGYALLPAHWGRGYMTEALRAGLAFMFETLGAQGISDCCESTNPGSMRVMEKAGLRRVARWTEEGTPARARNTCAMRYREPSGWPNSETHHNWPPVPPHYYTYISDPAVCLTPVAASPVSHPCWHQE